MQFDYAYRRSSMVSGDALESGLSFSPDLTREPAFFRGELRKTLEFREAISALHDVVISDLRFVPKDRTEYKEWLAQQEQSDLDQLLATQGDLKTKIDSLSSELHDLRQKSRARLAPFYAARQRYFDYIYKRDYDAWLVLDPVITVHPDQVFFECFSQDESTYGRLSASLEIFGKVEEHSPGTTNVDYSQALYDEFQKFRTYKKTSLEVDPTGFEVDTAQEPAYKEVKIDLPESWVRGFLQVNSAMTLPATEIELDPFDIHNLCFVLRRHREIKGPRSLRFELEPGQPVRITVDPWNTVIECPRSTYRGNEAQEIRVWGRRRIHVLERLIPIAKRFRVLLLGSGMPSFFIADLGDLTFTLGLSGWTANDWSRQGQFDLLAPRLEVDEHTRRRVFDGLKENWVEEPGALAARLGLDRATVLGALGAYTQAGRAIYDLDGNVYRVRELSRDPLPMSALRFGSDLERSAATLIKEKKTRVTTAQAWGSGGIHLSGTVARPSHGRDEPELWIDADQRLVKATCSCNWYQQNRLRKGPCQHMLATRLLYSGRHATLEEEGA